MVLAAFVVFSASVVSPCLAADKKQVATNKDSRPKLVSVKPDSVYVASDAELKTFSNMSEVMEENRILKEQRQVLLDHSRLLRDKYKKLYEYCSNGLNSCSEAQLNVLPESGISNKEDLVKLESKISELEREVKVLNASLEKAKIDLQEKEQALLAIKSEVGQKVSSNNDLIKKSESELKDKEKGIAAKDEEISKLKAAIEAKTSAEKSYLEQLETSSSVILRIPELEKEIISLKNQLLIKKTTAELLGVRLSESENQKVSDLGSAPQVRNIPAQVKSNFDLAADVTVVEVMADKVSLRVGPGVEHSAIMDVQKGTRLTVEAREGKWLRVNSPTGGRAFISSEFVRGLDKSGASIGVDPRRTVIENLAPVSKEEVLSEQEIPMNLDAPAPVRPNMPKKAPRKVAPVRADKDVEAFGELSSSESVAMDKLMKAMQQPQKKEP